MSKQSVITGFTVPKKPDTPKRKRQPKGSSTSKEPHSVQSPSQNSPDQKKVVKDTPALETHEDILKTQEIKAKTRGRSGHKAEESSISEVKPPAVNAAAVPLPPSPPATSRTIEEEIGDPKKERRNQNGKKAPMDMETRGTDNKEGKISNKNRETKEPESKDGANRSKVTEELKNQVEGPSEGHTQAKDDVLTSNPMKRLTFKAVLTDKLTPILPQFKSHRVHVSFAIKNPKNKAKRTEYLARGLNKFLVASKKMAPNERTIYVRRFKDHTPLTDTEKPSWIDSFAPTNISHLMNYTHGFYANQALRDGTFRFSMQLVVPITTDIPPFLDNINGIWGEMSQIVKDCREQKLFDPKQIGWFLRSNWQMSATSELQNALDKLAADSGHPEINFGLQFKTIPSPGNKKEVYDKDTAIRAIVISTNAPHKSLAWGMLFKAYNSGAHSPLGIDMHFIPTKDHPDIRNNQTAIHNITYLMESQRIFGEDTHAEECHALADPDQEVEPGITLRYKLIRVTSTVSGEKKKGARLFHSITSRMRDGVKSYFFTYHRALEKEALSIIAGLPSFLNTELGLDPAIYCYPTHINNDHEWVTLTRTIKNSTVDFLSSIGGSPIPQIADGDENEDDSYEMDSQGQREFLRIVGLDDSETIVALGKKKPSRKKEVPAQVGSEGSVHSEMSGLTNFSSASKASQHRKELRKTIDDQRVYMEEQEEAMKQMQANFLTMMQAVKTGVMPLSVPEVLMPQIPTIPVEEGLETDTTIIGKEKEFQTNQIEKDNSKEAEEASSLGFEKDEEQDMVIDEDGFQSNDSMDDIYKDSIPKGKTFVDKDGTEWETGSQLSIDNPDGEPREIDESWFEVTQGDEQAARSYAMKMYREGHEVVLSRTGVGTPGNCAVYVVVHESETQGTGQNTSPTEVEQKVGFNSTTELQEYDPLKSEIAGDQDVIETKKSSDPSKSTGHNPSGKILKPMTDENTSMEEEETGTQDDSLESVDTSKSSSQAASESSSSSSGNSPQDKAKTFKSKQGSKSNVSYPPQDSKTTGRRSNLTKDIVAATAKMKDQQTYKRSTPRGKQKHASGEDPGQRD